MGAFGQFWVRGEFPLAILIDNSGADFDAVVDDGDDIARLGAIADKGRCGVVGAVAVTNAAMVWANVVLDVLNTAGTCARLARQGDVDDDWERQRRGAGVTGSIFRDHGEFVRTFDQLRVGRKAPLAFAIGQHTADFHAIVVDVDDRTGFTGTAQGRRGVIGVPAAADLAFLRRHVIVDTVNQWARRCHGVDNDFVPWRWLAFIAVFVDRHDHDIVLAIVQARLRRGVFPLAIFAYDGRTNGFAIVDDFNAGAWLTFTGERRGTVVSRAAIFDKTLFIADIVVNAADGTLIGITSARHIIVAAAIIAGCGINATQHTQSRQAQQSRPEPANTGSRRQAVAETGQRLRAQDLRRFNALDQEGSGAVLFGIGGNVFVVRAVFSHANQLAATAFEIFNNQLRLIGIAAFECDVQVFADALDGDVFWRNAVGAFGQNIFATLYRFDAHRLAVFGGGQFHRLGNSFAVYYGNVDYVSVQVLLPLISQDGLRTGRAGVQVNQPSCSSLSRLGMS